MGKRPLTLIEYITRSQQEHPEATGAFTLVLQAVGLACRLISREVSQAGLGQLMGLTGGRNVQGEAVARMDEFANDTLVRTLTRTGSVCAIGSEELAVPIRLPSGPTPALYSVVFDPLDGSSNVDYAIPVGTIFGIYRRRTAGQQLGALEDLVQPPRELVAAGYAVYGSSTIFVIALPDGVNGFTLDPTIGEFLLSHPDIKVPAKGKILSVNTGNRFLWQPPVARAIAEMERPQGGKPARTMRYVGSLVADAHRTLLTGGIFLYPADTAQPAGKLRLLYEAGPLAFLYEKAGGAAIDGTRRILELEPQTLHDRTPLILGSRDDVQRFADLVREPEPQPAP